jgi:hypothetical protein
LSPTPEAARARAIAWLYIYPLRCHKKIREADRRREGGFVLADFCSS